MSDYDDEWVECDDCGGTGKDEHGSDPLGRCELCCGKGERLVRHFDEDEQDDEPVTICPPGSRP